MTVGCEWEGKMMPRAQKLGRVDGDAGRTPVFDFTFLACQEREVTR